MELPPDPFLPDDPRLRDSPLVKYLREGAQLTLAFANVVSLSNLVEMLHSADRRDVELVAMVSLVTQVHAILAADSEAQGLTSEEADARWVGWLIGYGDGTLDDA